MSFSDVPIWNTTANPLISTNRTGSGYSVGLSTSSYQRTTLEAAILAIVMMLILVAGIVGNLLVFIVFYKKQQLLTISNRFILNLALSNFLMSVLVMPFVFISTVTWHWLFGSALCQITGFLMTLLFAACILTLLLISLDRYCAIVKPLHYNMRVTSKRANYALAVVWVLSVIYSIPPIIGWSRFDYQYEKYSCTANWKTDLLRDKAYTLFFACACFYLPFIGMCWIYCTIIHVAKKNSARARRNSVLPDANEQSLIQNLGQRRRSSFSRRGSVMSVGRLGTILQKEEWKTAKTSFIIMSTVTFCWLPYFVIITLESTLAIPVSIPPSLEAFVTWMALGGCAVNPMVYFFRNTNVRKEIPKVFRRSSVDLDSRSNRQSINGSALSNRRRSSVSTTGTNVTCLSVNVLHSEENLHRPAVLNGDIPKGWTENTANKHRRSLDSILNSKHHRPMPSLSNLRTHRPLDEKVEIVDLTSVELPGELPRETG